MAEAHRTNVLVTSCLKTPVDPRTKVPLASYERVRVLPRAATGQRDNRDYEKIQYEDSGSDFCDEDYPGKAGPRLGSGAAGERLNLSEIFSNEEYYSKLDELKQAHHRTMAELEGVYQQKLQLKSSEPFDSSLGRTVLQMFYHSVGSAGPCRRCFTTRWALQDRAADVLPLGGLYRSMLQMFYYSVISSIFFYAVIFWGSRVKKADANRLFNS